MHYTGEEYLKSEEEMKILFSEYPDAITNTQEIVAKIEDYKLQRDIILPVFPLPEGAENIITLFINMLDAGSWEREFYIIHPSPNILLLQYVKRLFFNFF